MKNVILVASIFLLLVIIAILFSFFFLVRGVGKSRTIKDDDEQAEIVSKMKK